MSESEYRVPNMRHAWLHELTEEDRAEWVRLYGGLDAGYRAFCADLAEG